MTVGRAFLRVQHRVLSAGCGHVIQLLRIDGEWDDLVETYDHPTGNEPRWPWVRTLVLKHFKHFNLAQSQVDWSQVKHH